MGFLPLVIRGAMLAGHGVGQGLNFLRGKKGRPEQPDDFAGFPEDPADSPEAQTEEDSAAESTGGMFGAAAAGVAGAAASEFLPGKEEVVEEFQAADQQFGAPASAGSRPQDPASVVDTNRREMEDVIKIASGIALDGVPIRGEIKTTGVGSML